MYRSPHDKLPKAITSDPTIGFLSSTPFQKLKMKISLIRGGLTLAALEWPPIALQQPQAPIRLRDTHFSKICSLPSSSLRFFLSLPNTKKGPKKLQKNTSKSLDSSLFTKNTRYCFCTQSSFPWFYSQDLEFRGMDVAFLAIIHTTNLLDLFSSIYLSF